MVGSHSGSKLGELQFVSPDAVVFSLVMLIKEENVGLI
jgi:hypothetical protein